MKDNTHYIVETKFWRRDVPYIHDENHNRIPLQADLVENTKKFEHKNVLEARIQAFTHYESILEVLYQGLGKTQTTDEQARIDMQHYLDSGNGILLGNKGSEFKMNSMDVHNRIQIYWVYNGVKFLIHGIHYLNDFELNKNPYDDELFETLDNLTIEYNYYKKNGRGHNYIDGITTFDGKIQTFLLTPVDWEKAINTN